MAKVKFKIIFSFRAKDEINEAALYYENLKKGLGKTFYQEALKYIETLKYIPFFEVKYDEIRTLSLKKFPYKFHFSVNEKDKEVIIHALTNNYQNPQTTVIKK